MRQVRFRPSTPQEKLLESYAKGAKGKVFVSVRVGKDSQKARHREIDGVRIPSAQPAIGRFAGDHEGFALAVGGKIVEAIEVVDDSLHRWVIGQAIVAKHLLEIKHRVSVAVPVVVCERGDELLEQVCARLGVKVWTPATGFLVP